MTGDRVSVDALDGDTLWRVTFGDATGNILDAEMMTSLTQTFHYASAQRHLKAIVLEGAGDHFSYGASIHEHLPAEVPNMLRRFHDLLLAVLDSSVIVLAAVRGRCLGGGLELAALAHRIFAHPEATFGQPEIALGVFAPVASVILPLRIAPADAEDLCLSGRTISAHEAAAMKLVDGRLADDPAAAALEWARTHLGEKSASSLGLAVRAVRTHLVAAMKTQLPLVERLYLDELMSTEDAREGIQAFLEKRSPRWTDA